MTSYQSLLGLTDFTGEYVNVDNSYIINAQIDNLSSYKNSTISLQSSLIPNANNSLDLGSATYNYKDLYVNNIVVKTLDVSTLDVDYLGAYQNSQIEFISNVGATGGINFDFSGSTGTFKTSTGKVTTKNNTLDDGSGNAGITGTLTVAGLSTFNGVVDFNSTISTNIVPTSSGTYDIGSLSNAWHNGYFNRLHLPSTTGQKQFDIIFSGSTGFTILDEINGINWLYQGGTGKGYVRTMNNILDDGSGNMNLVGTLKTNLIDSHSGSTITLLEQTTIDINGSNALQVQNTSGSPYFSVNTLTGAITSTYNSMDDGTGNMYLNYTSATTSPYIKWEVNSVNKMKIYYDTSLGFQIYDMANNNFWLYQNGTTAGYVASLYNILDDGHGNMTVSTKFIGLNGANSIGKSTSLNTYWDHISENATFRTSCVGSGNLNPSTNNYFQIYDTTNSKTVFKIDQFQNTTTYNNCIDNGTTGYVGINTKTPSTFLNILASPLAVNNLIDLDNGNISGGTGQGSNIKWRAKDALQAFHDQATIYSTVLSGDTTNSSLTCQIESAGSLVNGWIVSPVTSIGTSSLKSYNNTLDDGSGNMLINYTSSTFSPTLTLQANGTNGLFLKWSGSKGCEIRDGYNNTGWISQGGTGIGVVKTNNNTLDDGAGNMTIAGKITGNNAGNQIGTTSSTNTYWNLISENTTFGLACVGSASGAPSANNYFQVYDVTDSKTVFKIDQNQKVTTYNNTLDDGSGSLSTSGGISCGSKGNGGLLNVYSTVDTRSTSMNSGDVMLSFYTQPTQATDPNLPRIKQGLINQETGSNTGSDFNLWTYDDNGNFLHNALTVTRSNANVTINDGGLYISTDPGAGIGGKIGLTNSTASSGGAGTGVISMNGASNQGNAGWLKIYAGTTPVYLPYWSNIS